MQVFSVFLYVLIYACLSQTNDDHLKYNIIVTVLCRVDYCNSTVYLTVSQMFSDGREVNMGRNMYTFVLCLLLIMVVTNGTFVFEQQNTNVGNISFLLFLFQSINLSTSVGTSVGLKSAAGSE